MKSPDEFADDDTLQAVVGLICQRQVELRTEAKALGTRIYAEKPQRLAKRFRRFSAKSSAAADPLASRAPQLVTS